MLQSSKFTREEMIELKKKKKKHQKEAGLNVNNNLATPPNHSVAITLKQVLPSVSPSARGK